MQHSFINELRNLSKIDWIVEFIVDLKERPKLLNCD